jgi:hypothetical protein
LESVLAALTFVKNGFSRCQDSNLRRKAIADGFAVA